MLSREAFQQEMAGLEHTIQFGLAEQAIQPLKALIRQHKVDAALICQAQYLLAKAYWSINDFTAAKRYIQRCLKHPAADNEVYFKAQILAGDIMNSCGNYAGALKICLELLQHSDPNLHPDIFSQAYLGIAYFYLLNNEKKRALVCQRYAYSFAKHSNDVKIILKSALHLLQNLTSSKEFSDSRDIISFCWGIIKDGFTDPAWIAELHHYTGLCFIEEDDFDRGLESLHQSLTIHIRENLLWGQTQNRMALATLYAKTGDLKQACSMLESTILLASSFDHGFLQKQICLQLSSVRVQQGDFAAALAAQETYHRIEISYQSQLSKNILTLNQKQINDLDRKQEIIILQLENKSLHHEIKHLKSLISYQSIDPLTMLPDRRAFIAHLPLQAHKPIWGYLFSIENLIPINEQLGYESGDAILLRCSDLLQSILPMLSQQILTWFRYSGQQFILLSPIEAPHNLQAIFDGLFKTNDWHFNITPKLSLVSSPIQLHHPAINTLMNTASCWHYPVQVGRSIC